MTTTKTAPFGMLRATAMAGAVALALGAPGLSAQAQDAIKVGVLLPLSGNFAPNGQQTLTGIKMYLDEIGNAAAGHKLELLVEDSQGKPDVAVTKARKLVERDGVAVLRYRLFRRSAGRQRLLAREQNSAGPVR